MTLQSTEQSVHDQVNLGRLVKRLDKTVSEEDWDANDITTRRREKWLKVQGVLQKIKHARKLLKNVEAHDLDPSPKSVRRYQDVRTTLDRIDDFASALSKRIAPKPTRPAPILPTLPLPSSPIAETPETTLLPADTTLPTDDLLLSPSETTSPSTSAPPSGPNLIPSILSPPSLPSKPTSSSTSTTTPSYLQNSNALQQDLSEQLAQMASQLKLNALHFSSSLSSDRALVEGTQEKLEGNLDVMQRERVRLRDHSGKSWGTTWFVTASVIAVAISFVMMFLFIRVT